MPYRDPLPAGTLVRLKQNKVLGMVFAGNHYGGVVGFYSEWGSFTACRYEISVCRDQSSASEFMPMRLYLPYGKWTCENGAEVLFNRDYIPIWLKLIDGTVTTIDPNLWVSYIKNEFFFDDMTRPIENIKTRECCKAVLRQWGVEDKRSKVMDLFPHAIATGDKLLLKGQGLPSTIYPKHAA